MNQRLRIGIDSHWADKIFQGAQTHVLELFSEVIRLSPDMQLVLFLKNTDALLKHSPAFRQPNVELIQMPQANPFVRLSWQLPFLIRKHRIDIFHSQYILPMFGNFKGVVTIHDILFESHPQYFNAFFRFRSHILMKYSARQARHIFTVSEFSKNELMSRYKMDSQKITVIENGVDMNRFFPGQEKAEIISKRGLKPGEYILSVGRIEPRKNHSGLIRAYAKLKGRVPPLVIIGQRDFSFEEVYSLVHDLSLEKKVMIFEDVQANELSAFYRHARLFVYPTWAEGFGMPPLEAMASGVPVISSDTTSIPEVTGDAAVLVNPGNDDVLAAAMRRLLDDQALCQTMIKNGLEHARKFSWTAAAQKVRATYLEIPRK